MSAPNGFPGQQGWPPRPNGAAPADAYDPRQPARQAPAWPQQTAAPAQPTYPPQAQSAQGYSTQGRPAQPGASQGQWSPPGNGAYAQAPTYAQSAAQSLAEAISQGRGAAQPSYAPPAYQSAPAYGAPAADPYAPQFEPYAQAAAQPQRAFAAAGQPAAAPYAAARPAAAYPAYAAPPAGYGAGLSNAPYASPQAAQPSAYEADRTAAASSGYGDDAYRQQTVDDLGFSQAAGGELDPNYGEEDQEYDYEETPRRRRPMMVMAALCGAVVVGGGLAYGYKTIIGDGPGGQPQVIKSAAEPSKFKPADAGGKQFANADSKLMGRLGGGSSGAASASTAASAGDDSDASGARKVATLVVGRDGSIQAPPVSPVAEPSTDVGVPGVALVDSFGPQSARPAPTPAAAPQPDVVNAAPPTPQKVVVAPPPAKQPPPQATGSVGDAAAAEAATPAPTPPPAAKPKKVAAVAPPAAATASDAAPAPAVTAPPVTGGANGYVAVLASVPTSSTSRMDALKRYADMQQKYGAALAGKTPDVAEANLGAKGNYHRLVVGPPASREQANALCAQLKSQGYNDCWITSY
ncbi:MAG: SPOR domain-containing protein [Hyphomicrobium sp.]